MPQWKFSHYQHHRKLKISWLLCLKILPLRSNLRPNHQQNLQHLSRGLQHYVPKNAIKLTCFISKSLKFLKDVLKSPYHHKTRYFIFFFFKYPNVGQGTNNFKYHNYDTPPIGVRFEDYLIGGQKYGWSYYVFFKSFWELFNTRKSHCKLSIRKNVDHKYCRCQHIKWSIS